MAQLKNTTVGDTAGFKIATGTTAQRPGTPTAGVLRWDTSTGRADQYDGSGWREFNRTTKNALGASSATAATSLADLYNSGARDGVHWLTTGGQTYQAYCRFKWLMDDHWILILKVHNRGDMPSGSGFWTNTSTNNSSDFNLNGGSWAKYQSYMSYSFNYVAMDMNGNIPAIMYFSTARTMYDAMNLNGVSNGAGVQSTNQIARNSVNFATGLRYDSNDFIYRGSAYTAQTGNEPIIQRYGINSWANNASNSTTDNAGLSSVGHAGARIGCPLDEGSYSQGNVSNSGSDSGFGFGGGAGNSARTWSSGYGEWNSGDVVNLLPGRVWVK